MQGFPIEAVIPEQGSSEGTGPCQQDPSLYT